MANKKLFQKADFEALTNERNGFRHCNVCDVKWTGTVQHFGCHYEGKHLVKYNEHMDAKKLTDLYVYFNL